MKAHPMGEISPQAQLRLSMMEFYYQIKDVSVACRSFKTSRKTFYKWSNCYEESGKRLSSLEDGLKAPMTRRKTTLDFNTELKIKHLREKYIRLGKAKPQKLFKKQYGEYQEEFMEVDEYFEPLLTQPALIQANQKRVFYNFTRPHQTLDYLTPFEYYQ